MISAALTTLLVASGLVTASVSAAPPAAAEVQVVDGPVCDFNPIDPRAWNLGTGSDAPATFTTSSWYALPDSNDTTNMGFFVDDPSGSGEDVIQQNITGVTSESQVRFNYGWGEGDPSPGDSVVMTIRYAGQVYGTISTPYQAGQATYTGLNGATLTSNVPTIPGTPAVTVSSPFVLTLPASVPADGNISFTMSAGSNNVAAGDDVVVSRVRMETAGVCLSKETTVGTSGTYSFAAQGLSPSAPSIVVGDGAAATFDADAVEDNRQALIPTTANTAVTITETPPAGQEVDDMVCVNQATGAIVPIQTTQSGLTVPASAMVPRVQLQCEFRNTEPTIELEKSVSAVTDTTGDGLIGRGDRVDFAYTVRNTGTVDIDDITVTDRLAGVTVSGSPVSIDAGDEDTTTFTGSYTITAADVAAGGFENSAQVDGTSVGGNAVSDISDTGTTPERAPVTNPGSTETDNPFDTFPNDANDPGDDPTTVLLTAPAPALALVKSSEPDTATGVRDVGDVITYSFLVTNTGNVAVTGIEIDDVQAAPAGALDGPVTCPVTRLAPGAATTCTAEYTTTQADMDNGQVDDTATAEGVDPEGDPVVSNESAVTVPMQQIPAIDVVKTASDEVFTDAGQQITYTFVVTNTGNTALSALALADPFPYDGPITCAPVAVGGTLAAGDDTTCSATYTVTQDDLDGGVALPNTVVATGTPPVTVRTPNPTPVSDTSNATITPEQEPALALVKSVTPVTVAAAGDTVTYGFVVTNTGNVTVSNLAIDETAFSGTGTVSAVTCPATELAPTAAFTCTATYSVSQADVDAGTVTNTAVATGTDPTGEDVESNPSSAAITATPAPAISLVKSVDPATVAAAGDSVTYSFLVTNTGNVRLSDPVVTETAFSGTGVAPVPVCPAATVLAPQQTVTCTATYTVTQADIDAGSVTNTATATATPPPGTPAPVSDPSTATITAPPAPALTLVKSVDPATVAAAGDAVTYSFIVTNTGNVTVTDVAVGETAFSGTGTVSAVVCPVTELAPAAAVTCTATYSVSQADVDAGSVTNTAVATGTDPTGDDVESNPSSARITAPAAPSIALVKTADPTTVAAAGDSVRYSFRVTNTGNVTLSGIAIAETQFSGTNTLPTADCPEPVLAPGASETCTTTYTVSQADIDSGVITNTAVANGTPPGSTTPIPSSPSTAEVLAPADPRLALVKSAQTDNPGELVVGQEVTYSFVVTNTGNVTLRDVRIQEGKFTGSGELPTPTCPAEAAVVAPGAQVVCTTVYVVTQADVDAGEILNDAIATGVPPTGDPVPSPPSDTRVPGNPKPALTLVKSADTEKATRAGQVIAYRFTVTNTGNTTLRDVTVTEGAFSGHGTLSAPVCPAEAAVLVPGQIMICSATYTVVAADLTGQPLTNVATASAVPPRGDRVPSGPSTVTIPTTGTLPATGGLVPWGPAAAGVLLLLLGGVLVARRHGRKERELS